MLITSKLLLNILYKYWIILYSINIYSIHQFKQSFIYVSDKILKNSEQFSWKMTLEIVNCIVPHTTKELVAIKMKLQP